MKNVLVTGGAGFLGRYVIELFENQPGISVAELDILEPHCGGVPSASVIHGDITNHKQLENIIVGVGFDTIIHLAAYGRNLSCQDFPGRAYNVNVGGTANVLAIARRHPDVVKRVVCCSSNITLSDQPTIYKDTKRLVEELVTAFALQGVSCMGLRPSNIYGKGQSKTEYQPCAFAGLDIAYAKEGKFRITGDGTQSRDWVHAADVARAFWLAAQSGVTGETLDVCTGKLTSMNEVAELLGVPVEYVAARPGDAKTLISDPNPAWFKLGFNSEIKLADGIWDAFPSVVEQSFGEKAA